MGIGTIGTTGFLLIILVALLLFGPNKLPELGRAFGRTLREFKSGAKELMGDSGDLVDDRPEQRKEVSSTTSESRRVEENREEARRLPE